MGECRSRDGEVAGAVAAPSGPKPVARRFILWRLFPRYGGARRRSDPRRLPRDNLPAGRTLRAANKDPQDVQIVVEHLSGRAVAEIDDPFRKSRVAIDADCRVAELHELGDARSLDILQDLRLGFCNSR